MSTTNTTPTVSPTKIYIDWLSQPSRAVVAFCELESIPIDLKELRIKNMDLRTKEFRAVAPTMKVPALSDTLANGSQFNLIESHTIMRYLADRYNKSTLYPRGDIQLKATVDSYLDWHHTNTRKCAPYLFNLYFAPVLGIKVNADMSTALSELELALKYIENVWLLKGQNAFIGNNSQLTIADISCYAELAQMVFDNYDFSKKFPTIHAWMQRMQAIPAIAKAHGPLFKLAPKIKLNNKPAPKL